MHFFHLIKLKDVQQTFITTYKTHSNDEQVSHPPEKEISRPDRRYTTLLLIVTPIVPKTVGSVEWGTSTKDVCIIRFYIVIISAFIVIIPGL